MTLAEGDLVAGRFRVIRHLATGGMGAVFVAEHLETEQQVALKVLWGHALGSQDAIESFRVEAKVGARVQSEHIVRVIDAGVDPVRGVPFLAMELLRGKTLEDRVKEAGHLALGEIVPYLRQVASALDKAHGYVNRQGVPVPIVHRDLKPENLFLATREDGEPLVKILDFGIAKVMTSTTDVTRQIKGTPLFMASEQVFAAPVSPQTDIWSLGLIVFFLLTGTSYWATANSPTATMPALLREISIADLVPASERVRELGLPVVLPPGFDAWFARCLNREPSARFASAGGCAAALAALAPTPDALGTAATAHGVEPAFPPTMFAAPSAVAIAASHPPVAASSAVVAAAKPVVAASAATAGELASTDGSLARSNRFEQPSSTRAGTALWAGVGIAIAASAVSLYAVRRGDSPRAASQDAVVSAVVSTGVSATQPPSSATLPLASGTNTGATVAPAAAPTAPPALTASSVAASVPIPAPSGLPATPARVAPARTTKPANTYAPR